MTEDYFTPGWCVGGRGKASLSDGGLFSPYDIVINGSNLYVADSSGKVQKYDKTSGASLGWIGFIGTSPTSGAAGCNGAAVGSLTPGFCTGGAVAISANSNLASGGFATPGGITVDGTGNFYVTDTGGIFKYNSSGVFLGWNGVVATTPTGGDAGCTSLSYGSKTAGFCTGGTIFNGLFDGSFLNPTGININGTQMYVADSYLSVSKMSVSGIYGGAIGIAAVPTTSWQSSGTPATANYNDRLTNANAISGDSNYTYTTDFYGNAIVRFNKSTGAFAGWIGNIDSLPTGGDAGCTTAVKGAYTPGWCTGGYAQSSYSLDSGFFSIAQIYASGSYLYVTMGGSGVIIKINAATGAYIGWIGLIQATPAGGAAGCSVAGVGTFTPGWCLRGASNLADLNGDGGFNTNAEALYVSGNFIYATDTNMVKKYNATTGAFVGWIGAVGTNPTGGAAGCTTTGVNNFTPGWCTGGASNGGNLGNNVPGMLMATNGITGDGTYIYVGDALTTGKILQYNMSTGSYVATIAAGVNKNSVSAYSSLGYLYSRDPVNFNALWRTKISDGSQSWHGAVGTIPTGGDAGCTTAAVGTVAPGWCTGGAAQSSTALGGFSTVASSLYLDGTAALYIPDYARIVRYLNP